LNLFLYKPLLVLKRDSGQPLGYVISSIW